MFLLNYAPITTTSASPDIESNKKQKTRVRVRAEHLLPITDLNKEVGKVVPTPASRETACSDSLSPVSRLCPATIHCSSTWPTTQLYYYRHFCRQFNSILLTLPTLYNGCKLCRPLDREAAVSHNNVSNITHILSHILSPELIIKNKKAEKIR